MRACLLIARLARRAFRWAISRSLNSRSRTATINGAAAHNAEAVAGYRLWFCVNDKSFRDHERIQKIFENNATPLVATDDKSYMALEISGLTAKLVGIEGLTFGMWNGAVKVNTATDTDNNVATVPAKRFGTPEEFGSACAFLCSASAGYITVQNLLIDGGAFPGAF